MFVIIVNQNGNTTLINKQMKKAASRHPDISKNCQNCITAKLLYLYFHIFYPFYTYFYIYST